MTRHLLFKFFYFSLVVLFIMSPDSALAATAPSKIGDVISNIRSSLSDIPTLLAAVSYILGVFLAAASVFKFKDHVDNPNGVPLSDPVKKFGAAGMFFSGPYMLEVLHDSMFGVVAEKLSSTDKHPAPTGTGMDNMIYSFISNFAAPMEQLLIAFTYIAALILLLTAINRLTKTAQEGPRGPAGLGTLMTFLASGALFSFGEMMGTFSASLFGDAEVSRMATIGSDVMSNEADAAKVAAVIESILSFIMIVGYIAFIRGWFVLKSFADGNGQATLAQALTFLFGGTMAINLGEVVNILQETVGVGGISFS